VTHTCKSPGAGGEEVEGGGEPAGTKAGVQGKGVASAARQVLCHVFSMFLLPRMREVDLGCGKALLVKESGEFHAVGHKCPHYGAPLVKGQSASHPGRLTKGIKVLAKDSLMFIRLCFRAWGSADAHSGSSWLLLAGVKHGQKAGGAESSWERFTTGVVCW